jgi:hypothetical protein
MVGREYSDNGDPLPTYRRSRDASRSLPDGLN